MGRFLFPLGLGLFTVAVLAVLAIAGATVRCMVIECRPVTSAPPACD
jgi:hypothetical protein